MYFVPLPSLSGTLSGSRPGLMADKKSATVVSMTPREQAYDLRGHRVENGREWLDLAASVVLLFYFIIFWLCLI